MSETKALKFRFNVKLPDNLDEIMNKTSFKAFLSHVRNGVITRELVSEAYLPVGMSFEMCEAEALMDELKEVLSRCQTSNEKKLIVDSLTALAKSESAAQSLQKIQETWGTPPFRPNADDIFDTLRMHMMAGHSVSFVSPNQKRAERARERLLGLIREQMAESTVRHGRIEAKLPSGLSVFAQFGSCQPCGASAMHTEVVVLEMPGEWKVPDWTTAEKMQHEFEQIAAPSGNSQGRTWIYRTGPSGRIGCMDDGITKTFFGLDGGNQRSIDLAAYELWSGSSLDKPLTAADLVKANEDIRKSFEKIDWLEPMRADKFFVSPSVYKKMVEDIHGHFKIDFDIEAKPDYTMLEKCGIFRGKAEFEDKPKEGVMLRSLDKGAVSNAWRTPVFGVPAAAETVEFMPVDLKVQETVSVKFTPMDLKENDRIEVKFTVPKATGKTCKDTCTMADLLSHGHNPGCPEKK